MANAAFIVIGSIALLIAGFVGRHGWKRHQRHALVTETPTTAVRSLDDEGLVELKGTVEATESFESPIGGEESVLSAWKVEEWDERGDDAEWQTRAKGVYSEPFTLDDGTGSVRVAVEDRVRGEGDRHTDVYVGPFTVNQLLSGGVSVDGVFCSFEDFAVEERVPPDMPPPSHISAFVRGESGLSPQTDSLTNFVDIGRKHNERRYFEGRIQPGEEVYLLGEARAAPDATYPLGPDDLVVGPPDGDDDSFIVSDQSEDELVADLGQYRTVYAAAGALTLVGGGLLVYGLELV